jgi:hypothetical protein
MGGLTEEEKEERRAQALLKLAKAMGRGGGSALGTSSRSNEDEREVLESILHAKNLDECRCIAQVSRKCQTQPQEEGLEIMLVDYTPVPIGAIGGAAR